MISSSNKTATERWLRIKSFELDQAEVPLPFSHCLAVEMDWDPAFAKLAIEEYRKFILLSSLNPDEIIPSLHVDTVWHMHLLYTRNYLRFCKEALDCDFHHHEPANGVEGESEQFRDLYKETLQKYENFFGTKPPSEIWGTGEV